jgi:predicted nucleotidyltransferase component of viral defense system
MALHNPEAIRIHEDPDLFREALRFTAAETGFPQRLIEKDYFCSVILEHLATSAADLVFKGGTCLAKIHAGFYRLSEDLDFAVPVSVTAGRAERRRLALGFKGAFASIDRLVPGVQADAGDRIVRIASPLRGGNDSSQYVGAVRYRTLLGQGEETIRVEIGLREPLLFPAVRGEVRTLLLNPFSGLAMVPIFCVSAISMREAMAEKLRAALSRREPAIRDFYDVDHAVRKLGLDLRDPGLVEAVRAKLDVPSNDQMDVSEGRLSGLRRQIQAQLSPVLRPADLANFDLDRTCEALRALAIEVEGNQEAAGTGP